MNSPANTPLEQFISETASNDTRQARQLERRQKMVEAVIASGSIRIEDLAEQFDTSLMTVHRDLDELSRRGLLRKDRGVATVMPTSLSESSDAYRVGLHTREKKQIARTALEYLETGSTVLLDDSTTVMQLVPLLQQKAPLTIVTNSINVMNAVRDMDEIKLIGLGGEYYNWCNAFLGHSTINELENVRVDTVFVSISAIIGGVAFHQSPIIVETKLSMLKAATRKVLLADHSKFQQRALHRFAALSDFDCLITDSKTEVSCIEGLRAEGLTVRVARKESE
ncbi:MAG: DeoR/GlpR family DNA-binding transcription regulator [Saccharospirillum sp.]|nr:DeoR/GlpR family DNA-binding transcription regulator [Saccharospirillum sp.]